ncbi:MAG: sodium/solute symporter [Puniceicoccales bacterium]|jgi:SSS family solute:Na+ symporter|nr:sodium/solute symporter [Puniceicoccales bacterium]
MQLLPSSPLSILPADIIVFVLFLLAVVGLGLVKSRPAAGTGATSESYFLAGRGLKWWLIGISLIAANISSEQFVGMSGNAADFGMAVASYEWMAAVTLVVVAFCFLPYFLKTGIFTIPHFLEHRYNGTARTVMAAFTMVILIGVSLTGVIYAGALTMSELFAGHTFLGITLGLQEWSWAIGLVAALYVCAGGLKASAWADLIQGIALVLAGVVIIWLALDKLGATPLAALAAPDGAVPLPVTDASGGIAKLHALNHEKLTMFLPADNKDIPWTALLIGLWIPNFYYWGLNQYITQRVLGSASLKEGQKGIVFAAAMKLVIPFVIVIPGIIAFNLYSKDLAEAQHRTNQNEIAKVTSAASAKTYFEMDPRWALAHKTAAADIEARNNNVCNSHKINTIRLSVFPPDKLAAEVTRFGKDNANAATLLVVSQTKENAAAVKAVSGKIDAHNRNVFKKAGIEVKQLNYYKFDAALSLLIKRLLPEASAGLVGFVLAALLGAIVSSLAAVLNAASAIFTIDIFQKHVHRNATQTTLVRTGRITVLVFAVTGCVLAPLLDTFGSIFKYIQEFQGYISPGILAVFVFGLLNRRAPGAAGVAGLLITPFLYGALAFFVPEVSFLNRMAVCFFAIMGVMWLIGIARPLAKPVEFAAPESGGVSLETSRGAKITGIVIVAVAVALYVIFSPLGVAG